ncbi:MAG: CusA/CzcA family heavy metal efflux RND transporter [Verrucomicrobia subdivision 3 bacterium]|nr:CusA/CzcA family heavy metal efflux RND transporter [Limisphaerales bacterium]
MLRGREREMIARIIELVLRRRVFVLMAAMSLIAAGVWSALRLPIDAVPDITNVQVVINTTVPALSPEEVEKQVSFPVEMEMAGVQGLEEIRSLSKFGLSQITMVFADGTDIYRARQLAGERLQRVVGELPQGAEARLGPISTGLGEVYFYTLDYRADATNKPPTRYEQLLELRSINDFIVKPVLRSVPGVADVEIFGGYEKQIVVQPDPEKLASAGLSFGELAEVIRENVENAGGGLISKGGEQVSLRTVGRVQSLEEIANLPVKFGAGVEPLLVKDVARVTIGSALRTGAATVNAEEAIVAYTLMLTGANSRLVAQRVHERVREIQSRLPPGIEIKTLYNRSDLVHRTIRTVRNNLFEGAILVIAVLFALLGNWRAALIVASAIPLSMLFAVIGMERFGISGNLMSLGAIDFGLIVDGSVVIAENAVRLVGLRQRQRGRALTFDERLGAIVESCKQVGAPMVFGVTIITIVYVPILALAGTGGKMFRPMAFTVIFALLGSLLLALTLIPVFCAWFLSRGVTEEHNRVMRWARALYAPTLRFALRRRVVILLLTSVVFVGAVLLYRDIGAEFIPQLDEGSLVLQLVGPTSISLDESLAMQKRAEQIILRDFPEITSVFSRIGTPEIGTDPMGANLADTYLSFAPREKWRKINGRTIDRDQLSDLIARKLEVLVPGQDHLFTQPIEMRFNEMLEGARSDIAVKIYGEDFPTLQKLTGQAYEILEKIRGTGDIELDSDNLGMAPVLDITPDRAAMRRYNVHAGEINQTVATALGGVTVGSFFDGNRRHDIVVRMADAHRSDLETLRKLPVRVHESGQLPLGTLAKISVRDEVNMIEREGGRRRVGIEINLRGRDIESWVNEAQEMLGVLKLPEGYHIEFGGQFKQMLEARSRLAFIVPVALILIFMLIFAAFGSVSQALLVFVSVPLAVTGGVAALWLRNMPFSISAAVGFIALSGIAVLNGIMIITFINQLRTEGKSVREAVIEGSLTRLRPKLMTALVASLGFVPMAIATGAGAEVQRPLATVVIGGIISSTFLTLVLLPVLYDWIEQRSQRPARQQAPARAAVTESATV